LYAVCEELARESKSLDPSLAQRLDAKGLLGSAVPASCRSLARAIGTTANVQHYARTCRSSPGSAR
jgi:hypothetical protein